MAVIPVKFQCELGGESYDTALEVRDEIAVQNGADSRAYAYVCADHLKQVVALLDREFVNNKYAERARQAAAVNKI